MEKNLFGFCGVDCPACPAFHASDVDCVGCIVKEGAHVG
jgi:hypothetical protein